MLARRTLVARTPVETATFTIVALLPLVVPAPALRVLRPRALDFLGWPLESPERLAERFDLALVGSLLALGFLEQFEQFIELVERIPKRGHNLHHLVDGLSNGGGLRWLEIADRPNGGPFDPAWWRSGFCSLCEMRFRWLFRIIRLR